MLTHGGRPQARGKPPGDLAGQIPIGTQTSFAAWPHRFRPLVGARAVSYSLSDEPLSYEMSTSSSPLPSDENKEATDLDSVASWTPALYRMNLMVVLTMLLLMMATMMMMVRMMMMIMMMTQEVFLVCCTAGMGHCGQDIFYAIARVPRLTLALTLRRHAGHSSTTLLLLPRSHHHYY